MCHLYHNEKHQVCLESMWWDLATLCAIFASFGYLISEFQVESGAGVQATERRVRTGDFKGPSDMATGKLDCQWYW